MRQVNRGRLLHGNMAHPANRPNAQTMPGHVRLHAAADAGVARVTISHPGQLDALPLALCGKLREGLAAFVARREPRF